MWTRRTILKISVCMMSVAAAWVLLGCEPAGRLLHWTQGGADDASAIEQPVERQTSSASGHWTLKPGNLLAGRTIVLDAGHGGRDLGAWEHTKSSVPEKRINLHVARLLAELLESQGAHVVMTRDSDRTVSLWRRVQMAEKHRADLFVSIHADSFPKDPDIGGATVFLADSASAESVAASRHLTRWLRDCGISCRGVRKKALYVLRRHSRPAVLVECGFLTNSDDAERLSDPVFRANLATALAAGVVDHLAVRGQYLAASGSQ